MCGIVGYVGEGNRDELEKMLDAIRHRGPDDSGILLREQVGLAHARLSIIDTSSGGHQPMELPDKSAAIVFNGEIYNYMELREDLIRRGAVFQSTSDTEVLLWLYKIDGEDFLKKCVGMFAIALYDFKKKQLILARDRMGEKPLYWTKQGGAFLFASELRGLMASPRVKRELDLTSVRQYLAHDYVPTPMSIFTGVFKLEPATMLIAAGNSVQKKKYWAPPDSLRAISETDAQAQLDALLQKSVSREVLAADVPLGVFLSGGLDSSTVAYYAQKASSRPIDTFSIGFSEQSFDESAYAREVASHIGSNHHEEMLSAKAALDLVDEIPDVLSEPMADASVLPTMLLSRFARKSVTVALGGDGSDELFAGYPTFKAEMFARAYRSTPVFIRSALRSLSSAIPADHTNFSFAYGLRKFLSSDARDPIQRHLEWLGSYRPNELALLAGPALHSNDQVSFSDFAKAYAAEFGGSDTGNQLLYMYARTYLMDEVLVKVDRASMHYALETRAPFLDHEVVDLVYSLPYEMKFRRGTTKYLLKKLMRGKLPLHIVNRAKKGFGIPLARWLTKELRPLCDELLSSGSLQQHQLFDQTFVDTLRSEHMDGRRDHRKELWSLMVFQLWYQKWMA